MSAQRIEDAFELTPVQEGMLFQAKLHEGSGLYVVQLSTPLSGPLDVDAFRSAWAWTVARHGALRTGFVAEGVRRPVQVVHREAPDGLEVLDWRAASPAEAAARLDALREGERARGFRLAEPPLVRVALVRLADDEHVLLWTTHHLVLDGWSYSLCFRETLARYDALVGGPPFEPPPPRPYRDFLAWVRGRDGAAARAFWSAALEGVEEATPVAAGTPGAAAGEGVRNRHLSEAATAAVAACARTHRVTQGTLVQGAWALVLARHAGRDDVVFGATTSGRPESLQGSEGTCGLFVNTIPARVRLPAGAEVGGWLRTLQEVQREAREHEHTPMVDIQGWSAVPRGLPLFESVLAFENFPRVDGMAERTGGLRVGRMEGGTRTGFPLTAVVHPGERLHLRVYHDRARIPDAAAERMAAQLEQALAELAASAPERPLREIDVLPPAERAELLGPLAGEMRPFARRAVHDLVAEAAARAPGAVAVVAHDATLTYAELERRANRLAHHLAGRGVRRGDLVGVALDRSAEMVVALLAVLRAGAGYLPLDAGYPRARLEWMLDDSAPRVVVTRAGLAGGLPLEGRTVVEVDSEAAAIAAAPDSPPAAEAGPEDVAYVTYTSGSTGKPKGVLLPHRGIARMVRDTDYAEMGPDETFMQLAPVAFDPSILEIWGALANGARLAVFPPHPPTLDELRAFVRERGVTFAWVTVGLFHQVVEHGLEGWSGVRQILSGGDVLSPPHLRAAMEALPGTRFVDGYGPTENSTFLSCHTVVPADVEGPIPIGRPVTNTRAVVLDHRLRLVPRGAVGELCAAGEGVAHGYLGRPALTAERFVPSELGGWGERVYRTGDLARWREDGTLEFLGRMDQQVKIRGFRVEPGEVEAVLLGHPGVRQAAVVAQDAPGGRRLVAYWAGTETDPAALRTWLARRLPEHMLPAVLVSLPALPLTPNEKVDRRALPAPDAAGEGGSRAPAGEAEELLAALWAEVLGRERVGADEPFFVLGGHSLQAMQVVARIREVLRVELPLRDFFDAATVAGVAARLAPDAAAAERLEHLARFARLVRALPAEGVRAQLAGAGVAPPRNEAAQRRALVDHLLREAGLAPTSGEDAIAPRPAPGPAPLSLAQERMRVMEELEPGRAAYTVCAGLRLHGALDAEALRRAFAELARRHEALRSRILEVDGEPVQVAPDDDAPDWETVDLSPAAAAEREAALAALAAAEGARPFDLAAGPPLRVRLVRLGDEEHALLLLVHHAFADGWSLAVMYRELAALYGAFRRGEPSPLPPPLLQFADYAAWERARDPAELEPALGWWRRELAGLPAGLDLPADRTRPAVRDRRGAVHAFRLAAASAAGLRDLARGEGATLFMALLAGYAALLHRCTGADDLAVGTPVAGRPRAETEGVVGLFVNTLAIRADLGGDPPFRELVRRVRDRALGAYAHQAAPFERVVEAAGAGRVDHHPLFSTLFALQNAGETRPALDGVRVERLPVHSGTARMDLTWSLVEREGAIEGLLEYATDLFDAATAERMAGWLDTLLAAASADPDLPLSALPLAGEAERRRIVEEWSGEESAYPRESVDRCFAAVAAASPGAAAVEWAGGSLSYGALDIAANRLAARLRGHGVAEGARVGICLERGPELVAATLAVLKAGGVYVPLDPAYPADRLAWMLEDSGAAVVLATAATAEAVAGCGARLLLLDGAEDDATPAPLPAPATGPDSPAYVMYTSGSTGQPKGTLVPHRAIVRLVRESDFLRVRRDDVFLQMAPASFDAATLELWAPLLNGARLALHPPEAPSADTIEAAVRAHGVSVLWLTAGLFHLVVDERIRALQGVRVLLAGGDALSVPHVRRVLAELPGTRLVNGYGPTENTTFTCCHAVDALPDGAASVPIGRPIAATRVYVLDLRMEPVPTGVPGELYAGGAGVALGYLDRPGATAERFVPSPFAPGDRLYRTGDRVRWLADGTLEFLGRMDRQVKIRGFRVEPGEVEAALLAHPEVREAAVVVRGEGGEKRLAAYAAGPADAAAVRAFLRARLPEHMLPASLALLERIPLTPNGKVDRAALPEDEPDGEAAEFVAPRDATEATLAELWSEVLALPRVGVHDDFFALGGHSLRATRLASRIRAVFAVELPLRDLFEAPTVAALARRVDAARGVAGMAAAPPVVPLPRDGRPLAASFAQRRLWFLDQLEPGLAAYNVPVALRLSGVLDEAALERALAGLVSRHEALRTVFRGADGDVEQVVLPAAPIALAVEDLTGEADPEAAAERHLRAEAAAAFDLARGPLFRARLLRLAPDRHLLAITLHHAVGDGWSLEVLFRELAALYAGRALPPLPIQYADFAAWQRERLSGGTLERELAWWRAELDGAPPVLELPTDRPRPAVSARRAATERLHLPPEVAEGLRRAGRAAGATPFMSLLAAFQATLAAYAGQEEVVVGAPIAGRTRAETEGLVGFFANTLALRTSLAGDPTFGELLGRVRETALGAFAHQEVPFEKLVEELRPDRSLGHAPVFQAFFALRDTGADPPPLAGLAVERVAVEEPAAKFDLALSAALGEEGVACTLLYDPDLFDAATVRRVLDRLGGLLRGAAEDPARPLSTLLGASEAERAEVAAWEAGAAPAEEPACFPALFAACAAAAPHAVAVECGGAPVSYGELDAASARLARHLHALGIGAEDRVALLLPRTAVLVEALLGVARAGAAYLPLEPAFPAARIREVLEDAGAVAVLTTGALAAGLDLPAGCRALALDDPALRAVLAALPAAAPEVRADPDALAHVIYTSGSTGRPKGVMVRHGGVAALLAWMRRRFPLATGEKVLGATSLSFDVHVAEVHFALGSGATLVLVENALSLAELPAGHGVAHAAMVPGAARELLAAGVLPGGLRRLVLAGEALGSELADALAAAGVPEVHDAYGPTEDTTYSTHTLRQPGSRASIGRAVDGSRAMVLDRGLRTAGVGIAGELYLGGEGVARGYLGRPALTAERFLPDPHGAPGARMYATGDRARWRAGGELEYLGRADLQVKVRGYRIEPGEVEAALRFHPSVRDAVVVARDGRLAAYVAAAPGERPTAAEVAAAVRDRLPAYMVPAAVAVLDALPRTASGKVDRRALPEPDFGGAGRAFVAPRTPVEAGVAEIYAGVLRAERVGAGDDFFSLGGHSLAAVELWTRLRDRFGVDLPLRALFETPSVEALARAIEGAAAMAPLPPIAPVTPRRRAVRALAIAPAEDGGAESLLESAGAGGER